MVKECLIWKIGELKQKTLLALCDKLVRHRAASRHPPWADRDGPHHLVPPRATGVPIPLRTPSAWTSPGHRHPALGSGTEEARVGNLLEDGACGCCYCSLLIAVTVPCPAPGQVLVHGTNSSSVPGLFITLAHPVHCNAGQVPTRPVSQTFPLAFFPVLC